MVLAFAVLAVAPAAAAQTPTIVNGTIEQHDAVRSIENAVESIAARGAEAAWVGYAVPTTGRPRESGCWTSSGQSMRAIAEPVKLEGPDTILVLARLAERRVNEIRVASSDCSFDAGGLTLHWLTGVRPADSVSWLASLAANSSRRLGNTATMAIALHAAPDAVDRLVQLARRDGQTDVRGTALFWLAQRAGDQAVGPITEAIDDPEAEIRTRAVFALTLLPTEERVTRLIDLARSHRDAAVRRQAMFWLGQSRDPRVADFLLEMINR
jgi:HEAT repeat protein